VLEADKLLSAIGFAPRVEGYGLESTGVASPTAAHRHRRLHAHQRPRRLRHRRLHRQDDARARRRGQGIVAAETIAGAETMPIDYDFIPRATYCHPQIGSFGYSEAQAKEKGYDVKTATFPFAANGKAMGLGDAVGFVKVVADAKHNEILGAHMIGPDVTELLPVLTLAQKWDLTADEVARNVFAHPTLSEASRRPSRASSAT
jgi:dihydrolipoamide dehydrogenase